MDGKAILAEINKLVAEEHRLETEAVVAQSRESGASAAQKH